MTIARLELQDFRCFAEAGIDFDPALTFLCAHNAAGKSSLLDSLEWCLIGSCRGTDLRGAGSKALIRDQQDSMLVRVIMQNGTYSARQLSRNGSMKADPPDYFVSKDMFRCLMNGWAFLDLAHADAKNLLLSALDVKVPIDGKSLTLAEVEAAYQMAFAERRDQKVRLNAIQVPPKPSEEPPDVSEIEAKLADLRAEEHVLVAKEAHGAGRREGLERAVERARKALADAQQDVDEGEWPEDLEPRIAALEDAKLKRKATSGAATIAHHRAKIAEAEAQIAGLRKVGTDINKHAPDKGCVLSADIPCKTEAESFKGHLRGLKTQADALKRDIAESQGVIEGLSAQLTDEAAEDKELAGLTALFGERGKAAVAVSKATFDLAQAERELADCPEKVANSTELQTLRERIRKGEGLILEARDLLRQRIEHEDKTKQREAAAEKLQALEARVELLGPKGARVGALHAAKEAFQHDINFALDEFGYILDFCVEPWSVNVNGRDSGLLSSSERLRVGLCFALALAKVTGINFVALDAADMLDAKGRGVLMEVLTNVEGVQVIVAATREEPLPSMDGLASYWLEREDTNSPTKVRRT